MKVSVVSRAIEEVSADLLAVPIPQLEGSRRLPAPAASLDRALGGALARAVASGDFRGKRGDQHLVHVDGEIPARRVLWMGLGPAEDLDGRALRLAAGEAVKMGRSRRARRIALALPARKGKEVPATCQALVEGAILADYRFDHHQAAPQDAPPEIASLALVLADGRRIRPAREGARAGTLIAESQNRARDLSNEPGNALPPVALAREARKAAKEAGLRFKALEVPELRRRKMGGLLAVGQGSTNPPRLIVLEHGRPGPRKPTVCLVGKGITFDSGGISIKPAAAMDEMKHDMSGAAAVVGALRAIGLMGLPAHVVGIVPAAENLPSHKAYRPGDIVRSAQGTTIEVLNTDAEGRVVLSDALHYAVTQYAPAAVVDLATLTGACVIALGPWASGMMGNDEKLADRVRAAGEATGERVWPLPLWDEHREHIKSQVADIKNTGGREAGTITAAAFLSHFTEGTPWVHLDIAATAWTKKGDACQPFGATGVGVRLLVELIRSWTRR